MESTTIANSFAYDKCHYCDKPISEGKGFLVQPVTFTKEGYGPYSGSSIKEGLLRIKYHGGGKGHRQAFHNECWIKSTDFSARIAKALDVAYSYGTNDGGHHKMWVIDQMVRELTGCPLVKATAKNYKGEEYEYETLGESEEYKNWVKYFKDGEDGPETYEWDKGCPP